MRYQRSILTLTTAGLLLALAAGCASTPKVARPSTDVIDGNAVAARPAEPAPVVAATPAPAPPTCSATRVHFGFDSSTLDAGARDALKEVATCLAQRQPADVVIEGHCDERGTEAYNMALGQRRAVAVKTYFGDLGLKLPMTTVSFGKDLPLVNGDGEAAWSQNRRAEFRLPGEKRSDGTQVAER